MATFRKRRSRKYKSRRKYSNSKKNRNNRRFRKSLVGGGLFDWFSGKKETTEQIPPTSIPPTTQ